METTTTMTGVTKKFNATAQPQVKASFPPLPAGEYTLKLSSSGATVGKSEKKGENAIPYVNGCYFTPVDSDQKGRIYMFWFLSTTGKSYLGGKSAVTRTGGILDFAQATGTAAELDAIDVLSDITDENGNVEERLDPKQVKAYLQALDGTTVKAVIKHGQERNEAGEETGEVKHYIARFVR